MLTGTGTLTLALSVLAGSAVAIDLDISNQESIKSAAKALASSVVSFYDESVEGNLTPGLFGEPYYWWESGLAFNTLIDYYGLTSDSQFNTRISDALQHQLGDAKAFMPANQTSTLGNDDQSFWGLASLSAHEVQLPAPVSGSWLEYAQNVFETQAVRWDTKSCNGGLRWQVFSFNDGYNYKNTASNGQLFLLAARLADQTGNATYAEWANKVYEWTKETGLLTDEYHVYDGTDAAENCSRINHLQWTSNHAEFTEGAALMYKLSNSSQEWASIVNGLANASSVFQAEDRALVEVACENRGNCDYDQRAFKGIATRSYARAALAAPIIADPIQALLNASAKGAAKNCEGASNAVKCGLAWANWTNSTKAQDSAADGNLGEILNALSAVQGLLWSTASVNDTVEVANPNTTSGASPSGASGAPESTGAGSTLAASLTFVMIIAFAAALSC